MAYCFLKYTDRVLSDTKGWTMNILYLSQLQWHESLTVIIAKKKKNHFMAMIYFHCRLTVIDCNLHVITVECIILETAP